METKFKPKPAQGFADHERHPIALHPVKSSQVQAIGYDEATKQLAVTFTRGPGHVYHYPDVDKETFEKFKSAESIGTFFGKHIKPRAFHKYPAPKI